MAIAIGILFAFLALISWGFGDFLIQRSTRKFGDWETLFLITGVGAIILTPFVMNDLQSIFSFEDNTFLVLSMASIILFIAALLDFEALKKGKIAVVEPIMALEVPVAAMLAVNIIREQIDVMQTVLIATIIGGLILVSLRSHHLAKKKLIERGVFLAVIGAIFMGASNFLVGFAARITNPLVTNWFFSLFIAIICAIYLIQKKRVTKLVNHIKTNKKLIFSVSILDNMAWVAFAFSMVYVPIAIAVAISESYIALAALLGLLINKEKLLTHQWVGLVLSIASAVILAAITR